VAVLVLAGTQGSAELRHERAPFWKISPDDYATTAALPPHFPETGLLPADRDIGVAFAGGGTRSASATIGELRGLQQSKLLARVRYVSAVSGGAWAVIPWIFSGELDLLGTYEEPGSLTAHRVKAVINGALAEAVHGVSIELAGAREGALIAWAYQVPKDSQGLLNLVRRLVNGAGSTDRTYASLLRSTLLTPLGNSDDGDFQLDELHDAEYAFLNGGPRPVRTAQPQPGRPFMIINADVVNAGADFAYPYAIPFEFTPLYVGSRQSVGGIFGGIYTWPSAYNAATTRVVLQRNAAGVLENYCANAAMTTGPDHDSACKDGLRRAETQGYSGILEYSHDDAHARISLSDVAASTGAAPLFFIAGGNGLSLELRNFIRLQGGAYFPQFTHVAFRNGDVIKSQHKWPHADGGARDNLGISALLARQVKKIIVFVNVDDEDFNANNDIASLFVSQEPAKTSDKSGNVMFELGADADDHPLKKILTAFQNKRDARQPLVTCGRYDVKANPTFNIRAYRDVRVCWVYPERAGTWTEALPADVQGIINGQCQDCGKFENFPWFDTFAENRDLRQFRNIGLLRLTAPQVNLMTNLMAWTVATSADELRRGLDD
jgi:hypothetical protein